MSEQNLFVLECLSPVHIGSGHALARDLDYCADGNTTAILDWERLFSQTRAQSLPDWIADSFRRRDNSGRPRIIEFLQQCGIRPESVASRRVKGVIEASQLRLALRTFDDRPLIPGSSVKGALRTLFIVGFAAHPQDPHSQPNTLAQDALTEALTQSKVSPRFRARALESRLLREALSNGLVQTSSKLRGDPKGDLLRMVKVSDAFFPAEAIEVLSTKALGTNRETLTAVEALKAGSRALLSVELCDPFLSAKLFAPPTWPTLQKLAQWSQAHALHLVDADRHFFERLRQPDNSSALDALITRCDELKRKIQELGASKTPALVLRLGWGTGWRTMTGDLLTPEEREQLFQEGGRISRYVGRGKTCKVVLEGHRRESAGSDLLGWVCIRHTHDSDEVVRLQKASRPQIPPSAPSRQPTPPSRSPSPLPPPVDSLIRQIESLRERDWGRVGAIVNRINQSDPLKKPMYIDKLEAHLNKVFGKSRKRDIQQMISKLRQSPP